MPEGRLSALTRLAAMPGQKRVAGALAVAAAAVAISACGSSSSDQTIDPADATELNSALSGVELAVASGNCNKAQKEAQDFVDTVNSLPDTVGTANKEALRSAGENLEKLAQDPSQCKPTSIGTSGTQGDQPSTTTTTPETVPTTTTPTTTSSTVPEPPSGGNGGGNQGGGEPGGGPPSTPPGQGNTGGGDQTGGGGSSGGGTGSGGTGGTGVGGGGGGTG